MPGIPSPLRPAKIKLHRKSGGPDFLHAALDTTARAVFIKESRMKLVNANKLHRKSGGNACGNRVAPCDERSELV
jgi:hypothetical protein